MTDTAQPALKSLTLTGAEAAKLAKLCERTLKRAAERGEAVGRIKVGTAVRYHRATLERWIEAQAVPTLTPS